MRVSDIDAFNRKHALRVLDMSEQQPQRHGSKIEFPQIFLKLMQLQPPVYFVYSLRYFASVNCTCPLNGLKATSSMPFLQIR